jgi:hypothetical protein
VVREIETETERGDLVVVDDGGLVPEHAYLIPLLVMSGAESPTI